MQLVEEQFYAPDIAAKAVIELTGALKEYVSRVEALDLTLIKLETHLAPLVDLGRQEVGGGFDQE